MCIQLVFKFLIFINIVDQPIQDPEGMTEIIVQALKMTGQRGIINKGWGGLGNCKFCLCSLWRIKHCYSANVSLQRT